MSALSINVLKVMLLATIMLLVMADLNMPAHADFKNTQSVDAAKPVDINHSGIIEKIEIDPVFTQLDVNHDGEISVQEAVDNPALSHNFTNTDSNHDGAVTIDEFAYFIKKTPPPTVARSSHY